MKKIIFTILFLTGLVMLPQFCGAVSDIGGYWKLDGNNTNYGSYTINATDTAITYVAGRYNQGIKITTAAGGIALSSHPFPAGAKSNLTISFWFNITSALNNRPNLISFGGADSILVWIQNGTPNKVNFNVEGSAVNNIAFTYPRWHFITWTGSSGSNNNYAYVDGVYVGTMTANWASVAYDATIKEIGNGKYYDGSLNNRGIIDEVRVNNRTLSAQEIKTMYSAGWGIF